MNAEMFLGQKQTTQCWIVPTSIDILVWVVLEYAFEKSRFPGVRWGLVEVSPDVTIAWWLTSQPASQPATTLTNA